MSSKQHVEKRITYRGGGFSPRPVRFVAAVFFVTVIALWEWGARSGVISPIILPSPSAILDSLLAQAATGDLWRHLWASVSRLLAGWTLGTLAGLALGFAMGMVSLVRAVGLPFVSAIFPIPKIALLPLFIIWFGIGEPSKVATIAFGVFFPTVINAYSGVDAVDRTLIRMGQSFGLPHRSIVMKIVLPGALPSILSGFRISASIAIILLVAAEMIGAQYGIGALILAAGNLMRTDLLLAGVVVLSMIGLIVGYLLTRAERYLLRWR